MRTLMRVIAVVLMIGLSAQAAETNAEPAEAEKPSAFASQKELISYGVGLQYGRSVRQADVDLDMDTLILGIRDGLAGAEPKASDQEIQDAMMALRQQIMEKQTKKLREIADKNKAASDKYLAENAEKPAVVVLPSGLQYKVIEAGTGPSPSAEDIVTVHYTGTLPDGTVFDSTTERGQPAKFQVNEVIAGWTEALQKMKVGSKWELCIPPDLAYGEMGAGPIIGPNQALIFEVQLLDVTKAEVETEAQGEEALEEPAEEAAE